jgi:hypothetical protein
LTKKTGNESSFRNNGKEINKEPGRTMMGFGFFVASIIRVKGYRVKKKEERVNKEERAKLKQNNKTT